MSWIQNKIWSYSRSIVNHQTHHSSVIIIITITAYHCSLFNVYGTVTAFYSAKKQQAVHTAGRNFIKYAVPIPIKTMPIPIPISSPKLLPFPWESHGNSTRMGIPIPMHTSIVRATKSTAVTRISSLATDLAVSRNLLLLLTDCTPSPPIDSIWAMMFVWR